MIMSPGFFCRIVLQYRITLLDGLHLTSYRLCFLCWDSDFSSYLEPKHDICCWRKWHFGFR